MNDFQVHASVRTSATADLSTATYPQILIATAAKLILDQHFAVSIVVSMMACEVAVARKLKTAFAVRNIADLEDATLKFLNGYSLKHDRQRNFYNALTGDSIQNQSFWPSYKAAAGRRNKIIHEAESATEVEANDARSAATAFITHLGQ